MRTKDQVETELRKLVRQRKDTHAKLLGQDGIIDRVADQFILGKIEALCSVCGAKYDMGTHDLVLSEAKAGVEMEGAHLNGRAA
ncbi:hypothetical protein [Larkinella soli]|uniref:hypothetical protein n=1 Tax=Larkinella soli TaxID=1770527 RepID=UPI000FFB3FC8|nr:hypothetical protein [Larkinella soli]